MKLKPKDIKRYNKIADKGRKPIMVRVGHKWYTWYEGDPKHGVFLTTQSGRDVEFDFKQIDDIQEGVIKLKERVVKLADGSYDVKKAKFKFLQRVSKRGLEGIVFLGAGGKLNQWVKGINDLWNKEKIGKGLIEDKMMGLYVINTTGGYGLGSRTDLVMIFKTKSQLNIGKLAMWRLKFGDATWLSDYVVNYRDQHWESVEENKIKLTKSKLKEMVEEVMDESLNERRLESKVKKAILIAIEMSGDMTGAAEKIEKIKKGLSRHKKVKDALRLANESVVKEAKKKVPIEKLSVGNTYTDLKGYPVKIVDISGGGNSWKITYKDGYGKKKIIKTSLSKGVSLYESITEAGMFDDYHKLNRAYMDDFIKNYKKLNSKNVVKKKGGDVYGFRKGEREAHWKYDDNFKLHYDIDKAKVLGLINFFNRAKKNHPWG